MFFPSRYFRRSAGAVPLALIFTAMVSSCADLGGPGGLGALLTGGTVVPGASPSETDNTGWHKTGWSNRIRITFANSTRSALTNFPAVVRLNSSRVDFGAILANGADARFTDTDGTELDYEIAWWDDTALKAEIFVRVPLLDATDTDYIYMYYNNPSATDGQNADGVWNSDFAAVYHLAQETGRYLDSTGNGRHSSAVNVASRTNTQGFDGNDAPEFTNHWIELSNWNIVASGTGNDGISIEVLLRFTGFAPDDARIVSKSTTGVSDADHTWMLSTVDDGGNEVLRSRLRLGGTTQVLADGTGDAVQGVLAAATWYHASKTYDGANLNVYLNATLVETAAHTGVITTDTRTIAIGNQPVIHNKGLDAVIDEVRISTIARSIHWLDASNASFRDTMNTYGSPETN